MSSEFEGASGQSMTIISSSEGIKGQKPDSLKEAFSLETNKKIHSLSWDPMNYITSNEASAEEPEHDFVAASQKNDVQRKSILFFIPF